MADIVGQRQRLREVFVQADRRSHGARDLRNLNRMREAIAEMIGEAGREDLGLVLEPAEGASMHHAVAIALKFVAVGMREFGVSASAGALQWEAQMSERSWSHYCAN